MLFELAAGSLNLNTHYSLEPAATGVRLVKLHGSSNFWPDIPLGTLRNFISARNGGADVQASICALNQQETLYRCGAEDSLAPAIAMYAEGKAVRISPNYVEHQQKLWNAAVGTASRIYVVGVRVHNVDVHVWGELAKARAAVTYFGREWDREPYEEWRKANGKKHAYFIEATFDDCIGIIGSQLGKI